MSLVEIDRPSGTVLLRAADTGYVLRVDASAGTVRLLHWGAPLALEDALVLREADSAGSSFDSPLDGTEELAVDGQVRFAPPALDVRYADGTSATEPVVDGYEVREDGDSAMLSVSLRDAGRPLGWHLHYRVRQDCPVIERWTELQHTGARGEPPLSLVRHSAAQWNLPVLRAYRMSSVHGQWADEFHLLRTPSPSARRLSPAGAATPATRATPGSPSTPGTRPRRAARCGPSPSPPRGAGG